MTAQTTIASAALLIAAAFMTTTPAAAAPALNPAGAEPIAGDGVYRAFHEKAGVDRVIDDFVDRLHTDRRFGKRFEFVDLDNLRAKLKDQICYLVGGPCTYEGKDMKAAHAGMILHNRDFNALAEDLQKAMDHEGVPNWAQDRLLAKLAPMQHVIVNR
jgi:hemoglobin